MKVLVLIGSIRRNGNTDQVTGLIKEHLEKEARAIQTELEIETIYLGQENLEFCRGCRICFDRGEEHCPARGDILAIKAKMLAADGILLASPVYVDDVSGLTKTFIDRLCHLCHRPQFGGKVAYVVATSGGSPSRKTLDTMKMALQTWGYQVIGASGFKMGALMKRDETRAQFATQAALAARRLFQAISQESGRSPTFFSLMMFKIQQRAWLSETNQDTIDYRYWQQQGWLERDSTFYIPHRASTLKVAAARLTGGIIARFVT